MCKRYRSVIDPRGLAVVVWLVLLAGCVAPGPLATTNVQRLRQEAQAETAAGNLPRAVEIYTQLVAATTGAAQVELLTAGAQVLLDSGDSAAARRWLSQARQQATPAQEQQIFILLADVEMMEHRPAAALEILQRIDDPASEGLAAHVAATRGRALFGLGRVEEAVATLVEMESRLDDSPDVLGNHRRIWAGLLTQPAGAVYVARGETTVDGWLALAPVASVYRSDPAGLREGLLSWLETHPDHPAAGRFLGELLTEARLAQTYPEQIALLLPLTSSQQAAARAVRDGFIAAHLRRENEPHPRIKIYDTALLGAEDAYLRAQTEGADFIVGPLLKADIEAIIDSTGFVPTLALNSVDTEQALAPGFFQFALAPEDEAREIARYAVAKGALTAVALIPDSDWGLRLLNSFRAELETLGGQLLQFRGYDPESQDFSLAITTLLNINRSNQRFQRLAANLGQRLEFEPRRRQDVDMIFVAADSRAGHLLTPQLRFHYAGDLPTYAPSAIYAPGSRVSDADLDGVLFPDTPWVLLPDDASSALKLQLREFWPQRVSRWIRLYGMGIDAYRLVPILSNQLEPFTAIAAMSGELSLDPDGKIRRRLPLAQFQNGVPVVVGLRYEPQAQEPAELGRLQ